MEDRLSTTTLSGAPAGRPLNAANCGIFNTTGKSHVSVKPQNQKYFALPEF
jgi:hypothetical protein